MISAKNYAAQAEKAIREWKNMMFYKDDYGIEEKISRLLADEIRDSIHFAVPDNGEIFNDELKGLDGVDLRLPYKSITVEYFANGKNYKENPLTPTDSPKRLILAQEMDKTEYINHFYEVYGDKLSKEELKIFPSEIIIKFFVMNEIENRWMPCPMGMIAPAKWDYKGSEVMPCPIKPLVDRKSKKTLTASPIIILPGYFSHMVAYLGQEKALQEAWHDISGDIKAVYELCEALTCSNVTTETLQIESHKANAKRAKKGKLPIYETKTLSIEVPRSTQRTGIKRGDRSSPRKHLRRGHIRKLPDDRRIWVNSCAVGSPEIGRVDKSYRVFSA